MLHKKITIGLLEIRINWLIVACIMLTVSGLIRLGLWQLDRAQEKIAEQTAYLDAGGLQATPIAEVPVAGLEFDIQQHQNRSVSLSGEFLNENSIFMIYQTYEDQIGYEIVTPFKVQGLDLIVFISRGWTGIADIDELSNSLPDIGGNIEIKGQIFVPTLSQSNKTNNIKTESWPILIRYFNSSELQAYFDSPVFPYLVRLGENQPGVLIRHWPTVAADSSRNFSYSLQWFAMAIAVLLVSLILSSNILKLGKNRNN